MAGATDRRRVVATFAPERAGPVVRVQRTASTIAAWIGVLWIVFAADQLLPPNLLEWGVRSWDWDGLWGIPFAPFLHQDLFHLSMNSLTFAILGSILHLRGPATFRAVSVWGALGSGLGAWLMSAPQVTTVGLSGVLFAYLGFLMTRGLFERRLPTLALSAVVVWSFSSMLPGVLPTVAANISWQAHLAGFVTGVWCAARVRRQA